MAAVTLHERSLEQPGLGKKPRQHRQLEHDAHEQKQQEERVDVGVEGDKIRHSLIHLIIPQERDGEWNDNEISHQRAQHEHDEAAEDEQRGDAALCPVKRRRDEAEKDIKYKRRGDEQREIERCAHVHKELRRQPDIDEPERLELGRGVHKPVGIRLDASRKRTDCAKRDEVGVLRRKDDRKKHVLETEHDDRQRSHDDDNAHKV